MTFVYTKRHLANHFITYTPRPFCIFAVKHCQVLIFIFVLQDASPMRNQLVLYSVACVKHATYVFKNKNHLYCFFKVLPSQFLNVSSGWEDLP